MSYVRIELMFELVSLGLQMTVINKFETFVDFQFSIINFRLHSAKKKTVDTDVR